MEKKKTTTTINKQTKTKSPNSRKNKTKHYSKPDWLKSKPNLGPNGVKNRNL